MAYNEEGIAPPEYAAIDIEEGQAGDPMNDQYAVFPAANAEIDGPIVAANAILPNGAEEMQNIAEIHQRFDNALCVRCGTLNAKRGLRIGFFWLILVFISSIIRSFITVSYTTYQSTEKEEDGQELESTGDADYASFRFLRFLRLIGPICCIVTATLGFIGLRFKNKKKLRFAQKGLSLLFFFEIIDVVTSLMAVTGNGMNMFSVFINVFSIVILTRMMQTNKQLITILNVLNN